MKGRKSRPSSIVPQWYEFSEKNNKYFYNLEKINHKKKHITSLKEDSNIVYKPKQI